MTWYQERQQREHDDAATTPTRIGQERRGWPLLVGPQHLDALVERVEQLDGAGAVAYGSDRAAPLWVAPNGRHYSPDPRARWR